jgi:hypothetical protein
MFRRILATAAGRHRMANSYRSVMTGRSRTQRVCWGNQCYDTPESKGQR